MRKLLRAASRSAVRGNQFLTFGRPHRLAHLRREAEIKAYSTMPQPTSTAVGEPQTVQFSGSMDALTLRHAKVESPSAERNKQFILDVLMRYIRVGAQGLRMLEVASGSGQHVSHFAQAYPGVTFQPTDCTAEFFGSIAAYTEGLGNVLPPLLLDASQPAQWNLPNRNGGQQAADQQGPMFDGVIVINMTHISPWAATLGLMEGAARHLKPGGRLFMYGPFKLNGQHTSESNVAFDESLQARNPEWGYRDTQEVVRVAASHGLGSSEVIEMPANNFMLVFQKPAGAL